MAASTSHSKKPGIMSRLIAGIRVCGYGNRAGVEHMYNPTDDGPAFENNQQCGHKAIDTTELASELVGLVFQVAKENPGDGWQSIRGKFKRSFAQLLETWDLRQ